MDRQALKNDCLEIVAAAADRGYVLYLGHETDIRNALSTYPEAWTDRYVAKGYLAVDPVLQWMSAHIGQATWAQLQDQQIEAQAAFFEDAAAHGLQNGTIISAALNGDKVACSLSHTADALPQDVCDEIRRALLLYLALSPAPKPPSETKPEIYFLSACSQGLTDKEIGQMMGLSSVKLRQLKQAAIEKFDAKSLGQAVAFAVGRII
ncbi:autoinducer binding domain-containing protein [Oceanomicrobium pacificus]|uniref:Transcription factor LuxR-like autoinducer-binding domain-containing protein n=1 Tax=Oceanomicrobium pacificus TaxID=2692916 RepID=A0A6B0TTI3_9RHOB|nr:autoinducer binding domain-containing protein [Oceanomicrobium pacificus]MXU64544.1 hypothetical protein [Oceanomicrobium pacificus]